MPTIASIQQELFPDDLGHSISRYSHHAKVRDCLQEDLTMRDSLVPDHGVGDVLHEELYEVVAGILNLVPLFGHHDIVNALILEAILTMDCR
jgi:type III secretion system FlhB-like substrate exporter